MRRAVRRALVVADMPFGSYHGTVAEGVANAVRFVKEGGAEAVKIEGARVRAGARTDRGGDSRGRPSGADAAEHSSHGRISRAGARRPKRCCDLRADAQALAEAGAGALVLEGVPREVAAQITAELAIPTIGIGAGPDCDGQILVFHDLVNLTFAPAAKFVRRYGDAAALIPRCSRALSRRRGAPRVPIGRGELPPARAGAEGNARRFDEENAIVNRDALQDWEG